MLKKYNIITILLVFILNTSFINNKVINENFTYGVYQLDELVIRDKHQFSND
jgi:hypothetical protein